MGEFQEALMEVAPRVSDRRAVLGQLVESLGYVEELGGQSASVSLISRGLRLNVGQVEAFTATYFANVDPSVFLMPAENGMFLLRLLFSGTQAEEVVADLLQQGVDVFEMNYRSVRVQHWCAHIPFPLGRERGDRDRMSALQQLNLVAPSHRSFVHEAAVTPTGKLRRRSNFHQHHRQDVVDYAQELLSPAFTWTKWQFIQDDELLPSDLPPNGTPWEKVSAFALTYPRDARLLDAPELAAVAASPHSYSLSDLRLSLYGFQRGWRWSGEDEITAEQNLDVERVVSTIRTHMVEAVA